MFPLTDGMSPRQFPIVNVAIIVDCCMVWTFYELPHLNSSVREASFCAVDGSCDSFAAVDRELVHRDVHARQLEPPPGEHVVPGHLRQERRGLLRAARQLVEANRGLMSAGGEHGGTAFLANVGGFVFGVIVAVALVRSGRREGRSAGCEPAG